MPAYEPLRAVANGLNDGRRLSVVGALDQKTAPDVRAVLHDEIAASAGEVIVVDCAGMSFIDSTGLSMIINADGRAKKAGRRLTIVSGDGVPRRILRTVGLEDRLDVLSEPPAG